MGKKIRVQGDDQVPGHRATATGRTSTLTPPHALPGPSDPLSLSRLDLSPSHRAGRLQRPSPDTIVPLRRAGHPGSERHTDAQDHMTTKPPGSMPIPKTTGPRPLRPLRGEQKGSGAGWSRRGGPFVFDLIGTFVSAGQRPTRPSPAPPPRGSAQNHFLLDFFFSHLILKGREREKPQPRQTLPTHRSQGPQGTPGGISQAQPASPAPSHRAPGAPGGRVSH